MIIQTPSYKRYKTKVDMALMRNYSKKQIIDELTREKLEINKKCVIKQALLAMDRNIYKKREAIRAAKECIDAIDFICGELERKEIPA